MNYRYCICDVFTDTRFGGNQLAVLIDARGLSDKQMQQIAREFNFSESTFVLPPQGKGVRNVRIFTPSGEIPFAGHPNIGTAFVLASVGELEASDNSQEIVFEEKAGAVPITLCASEDGPLWCELEAPETISLGTAVPVETLAAAISLPVDEIITDTHLPRVASVGLPFVVAELRDRSSLERVRPDLNGFEEIAGLGIAPDVHLYARSNDEYDFRTRMFAPFHGVQEDPATGSANCALAGLLTHYDASLSGTFEWWIAQGVEMGRPSRLKARSEKKEGEVVSTKIGGTCVMVSEGQIFVD